ncbi:MAG: potassium channel family protein [Desulfobacterales bacterium]
MSRKDLNALGEVLDDGETGLVIVGDRSCGRNGPIIAVHPQPCSHRGMAIAYEPRVQSVVLMNLVAIMEVLIWGAAYQAFDAIDGFEKAIYFSAVTFTTLGYGDVVLDGSRRLLSSLEVINGIIMFGWSTAIVIAALQSVYFSPGGRLIRST